MIKQLTRKIWTHFLIAFNERYTLEGFERTKRKFECPENSQLLDSHSKRELTICNLFANQNQSIWNIARLLDISIGKVVLTLIEHGLIKERRIREKRARYERRQKPLCLHPLQLRYTSELPGQFELPLNISAPTTVDDPRSGNLLDRNSMISRRLAS